MLGLGLQLCAEAGQEAGRRGKEAGPGWAWSLTVGAPVSGLFPLALSTAARAGEGALRVAFLGIRLGSLAGLRMPTTPETGLRQDCPLTPEPQLSSWPLGPWPVPREVLSTPRVSPPC